MSVSAAAVKELRDKTGAGVLDCRAALAESGGDMEKAEGLLRQRGVMHITATNPALDGGRLLFVLISVVTRRLRPEVEGMAHALGMAALLTLIFVVSWHDVMNLINNKPVF